VKTDRRRFLLAAGAAGAGRQPAGAADGLAEIRQRGSLRLPFTTTSPYSEGQGHRRGARPGARQAARPATQVVGYNADEDMDDDLRNMVWKGHYLGTQPSDVMMHVPVDSYLQGKNDKVKIFGPYHLETIAVARVQRIGRSAARPPRRWKYSPARRSASKAAAWPTPSCSACSTAACARTWCISAAWPPPSTS
jgi:hypothetical protein